MDGLLVHGMQALSSVGGVLSVHYRLSLLHYIIIFLFTYIL